MRDVPLFDQTAFGLAAIASASQARCKPVDSIFDWLDSSPLGMWQDEVETWLTYATIVDDESTSDDGSD